MNDGIVAMVLQWSMLCVIWAGMLDHPLHRIGIGRSYALAIVAVSLICSYVSWTVYFVPVNINIGGFLIPLLAAGWSWQFLTVRQRALVTVSVVLYAGLMFFIRKLLFLDPILLVFEDTFLITLLSACLLHLMTRSMTIHWFMLLLAVPLSDALFQVSVLQQAGHVVIGSEHQQDIFWLTLFGWGGSVIAWKALVVSTLSTRQWLREVVGIRNKPDGNG